MKNSSILAALAFVSTVFPVASGCSAAPDTTSPEGAAVSAKVEADKKAPPTGIDNPAFISCEVDSDCVAVAPPTGCCNHGLKDAVNECQVSAWNKANACPPGGVCALFVTVETRVAQCNAGLCAMVAPGDIACDGRVENPHRCPAGWHCDQDGHAHAEPGTCEQVDASSSDNGQ